jgi:tungstate transport system substrate-binding protein
VNRLSLAFAAILVSGTCAAATGAPPSSTPPRTDVLLATTTSFQDSGLLDVLVADFQRRTPYRIRASAVGTGAALAIGARGDADAVFVHAPEQERAFMAGGNGERRLLVMHNDFVLLGPVDDPAHVKGRNALDALREIARGGATFISRGDNSGTDIFEKALWKRAGVQPAGAWYVEAATGMGQTLTIASEKRAYTISDRGTFLARRAQLQVAILVERDPPLINLYHVITVNPLKFPRVNSAGANAFADYLVTPETQRLIGAFGLAQLGEQLFVPDAGKNESDVR